MVDKVTRLELWHVAVPLPKPFHPAWIPGYPQTENRFTMLRVTTNSGKVGLAAGFAFSTEREGLGAVLGPYLMGLTLDRPGMVAMSQRLNELAYLGWRNHWIEAAFYDLQGQRLGHPLWRSFAGENPELVCYASTGERRSPEDAAKLVKELARRGFPAVKIRVHSPSLEEDLAVLRASADAAKEAGVGIAVDANQGWPVSVIEPTVPWGYERALKFARACAEVGALWLEEPLPMHDYAGYAKLRKEANVPLAGGELIDGWRHAWPYLEHGSLDILQVDCTFSGVTASNEVLQECVKKGVVYQPHAWTNGFGLYLNAHMLACLQHKQAKAMLEYPVDPPGWTEDARDGLVANPLRAQSGKVRLPDTPGIGAKLDEKALDRHGTKFFDATPGSVARQAIKEKGFFTALRLARRKKASS
jgi:L-alanine-DL-glutamate epimerase-like enolase superfamily enzyme